MTQENQMSEIFPNAGVVDDSLAKTLIANHVAGKTDAVTPMSEAHKAIDDYLTEKQEQRNEPIIKKQALFTIEGTEFGIYSGLASIFANEGEGKSQCANIICQSALKDPNRRVIVIDTEQGADEVRRRERTISFDYSTQLEVIYYPDFVEAVKNYASTIDEVWNLFKGYFLDPLKAGDVVVVDVVSDIVGDINDSEKAHLMAQDLQQLADKKRCAVIVVNHYNKNTTNSAGWIGTELLKKSANIIHVQRAYKKESSLSKLQEVASAEGFKFVAISGIVEVSGNVWQIGKCRFLYGQWFGWNRCKDDNSRKIMTIGEMDGVERYENVEYYKIIGDTNIEAGAVQMNARREQLRDMWHMDEMPDKIGLRLRKDMSNAFNDWCRKINPDCIDTSAVLDELIKHDLGIKEGGYFKKK